VEGTEVHAVPNTIVQVRHCVIRVKYPSEEVRVSVTSDNVRIPVSKEEAAKATLGLCAETPPEADAVDPCTGLGVWVTAPSAQDAQIPPRLTKRARREEERPTVHAVQADDADLDSALGSAHPWGGRYRGILLSEDTIEDAAHQAILEPQKKRSTSVDNPATMQVAVPAFKQRLPPSKGKLRQRLGGE
jgi:hypothetical protein